ncbi:conserved hypothetical protein [Histoplasma capsulatum var. duboisii H88]|uniref:Uncharacterized protein n=2 Tax=Ajellomyces capsulatus TaxID=5037 RepID=F0UNG5_AJEC8|nr:conserved hypothetical protein [Histoplasma capsulatum H143]EGC46780.1 conserved hypothetical protein [Histoplasma capsulatum var. duboisii H88]
MGNGPQNPRPGPYKKPYPVIRRPGSRDMFRRSAFDSNTKGPNGHSIPDADSEPEPNPHDKSSWNQSPVYHSLRISRSPDAGKAYTTNSYHSQPALVSVNKYGRRYRATDSGSPIEISEAFKSSGNSLAINPEQHPYLNGRLFEVYTGPNPGADTTNREETVNISNAANEFLPAPAQSIHCNTEEDPYHRLINDNMDKEANKENAPAETPIPVEEGGKEQLRWSNKHRRPLEALNLSDFYPIDESICPNSL